MVGYTCVLSALDLVTGYIWGYLLKYQVNLGLTPEELRLEKHSESRKLRILKIDNQFFTEPIKKCKKMIILLRTCIPPEHWLLGEIKLFN